jgi:hypothetical protein
VSFGSHTYSTTYDGTVQGIYTEAGGGYRLEYRYVNFTVTVNTPSASYTDTFNMSMTCSSSHTNGLDFSCEYYSDYHGYDGRIYRVSEVEVSGSSSSGYSVSVRVYDPDHGYVLVTTEVPLLHDCSGGHPSTGRIEMEDANGKVAVVEFNSCSEFTITLDGVANTYQWSDY